MQDFSLSQIGERHHTLRTWNMDIRNNSPFIIIIWRIFSLLKCLWKDYLSYKFLYTRKIFVMLESAAFNTIFARYHVFWRSNIMANNYHQSIEQSLMREFKSCVTVTQVITNQVSVLPDTNRFFYITEYSRNLIGFCKYRFLLSPSPRLIVNLAPSLSRQS